VRLLLKATTLGGVPKEAPLTPEEELLWRSVMRIVFTFPRLLDSDLLHASGVTASEYTTLMCLSEAPNREMRMADLANATGLSPSRTTRLVDDLQSRGLVRKRASSTDGRGNVAKLTPKGLAKLRSAWPDHLASVRRRMFDHIDPGQVKTAAAALSAVAAQIGDRVRGVNEWR
jgi:DNA-binding MarR family transcriptional regulator